MDTSTRITHLKWMILGRALDDRLAKLKAQGEVPGSVFQGRGQEAYSAAGAMFLKRGDCYAPLIRDTAGRLVFGDFPLEAIRTHIGRRTGRMKGRDGNIHRGDPDLGLLPMISHLGAMISVVNGTLLAKRLTGRLADHVGLVSIGDGAMNTGATHEALNQAAVERLPLVVQVADNQVAYSTFSDRTYACRDLVDRAVGYGMGSLTCDGTDADACLATMHEAIARARRGEGPQMVVAKLLRLAGHGTHDDAAYVTDEMKSRFGDCLQLAERTLKVQGVIDESGIAALWDEARASIQVAVTQALAEPIPVAADEDWCAYSERNLTELRA